MAKRKKNKSVTRRRRRRISGIGGNMNALLMNIGGIAAGAFLGNAITKMVGGKLDGKMLGAAKVGAGAFLLPKFLPGAMGAALGNGLMAVGSLELLQSFNIIKGIGDADLEFAISGGDDMHLISGDGSQQLISGAEDDYGQSYNNLAVAGTM